jgi:hypothetical protein
MEFSHYLQSIRERIQRFQRLPGCHLPIYEEHAGIDLGRYLGLIRNTEDWSGKHLEDYPTRDAEIRALIADHLVKSVQDLDELLAYIDRLEADNRRLNTLLL